MACCTKCPSCGLNISTAAQEERMKEYAQNLLQSEEFVKSLRKTREEVVEKYEAGDYPTICGNNPDGSGKSGA